MEVAVLQRRTQSMRAAIYGSLWASNKTTSVAIGHVVQCQVERRDELKTVLSRVKTRCGPLQQSNMRAHWGALAFFASDNDNYRKLDAHPPF